MQTAVVKRPCAIGIFRRPLSRETFCNTVRKCARVSNLKSRDRRRTVMELPSWNTVHASGPHECPGPVRSITAQRQVRHAMTNREVAV